MAHFLILGTQRTGTTLLKTTLNSHPDIHCAGELFIQRGPWATLRRAYYRKKLGRLSPLSYMHWVKRKPHYVARELVGWRRHELLAAFLNELYSKDLADNMGFKLMHNQGTKHPYILRWCLDHQIKIVHVVRANILKTLVSRRMTRLQPRAHSRVRELNSGLQVRLEPHRLVRQLQRIELATYEWQSMVGDTPLYMQLPYEDFVRNRETWLLRLFDHLEVPFHSATSPLKKLNSDKLSEVIANYDDVCAILEPTKYATFLDA